MGLPSVIINTHHDPIFGTERAEPEVRCRVKGEELKGSQDFAGQNQALTASYVPSSLDRVARNLSLPELPTRIPRS